MEGFVRGDVVVVPFPFSDLSRAKRRPALVVAESKADDLILCQITSQQVKDEYSISLDDRDFIEKRRAKTPILKAGIQPDTPKGC